MLSHQQLGSSEAFCPVKIWFDPESSSGLNKAKLFFLVVLSHPYIETITFACLAGPAGRTGRNSENASEEVLGFNLHLFFSLLVCMIMLSKVNRYQCSP